MKNLLILFLLSFLFIACKNETNSPIQVVEETSTPIKSKEVLETVPQYIIDSLIKNTNAVEGTMYNSGGSFSLSDAKSANSFVYLIASSAPTSNSQNQVGHLMFLNNGHNLLICSVYSNDNEVFARFDIQGKSYYNVLVGQASDMFTNVQVKPL